MYVPLPTDMARAARPLTHGTPSRVLNARLVHNPHKLVTARGPNTPRVRCADIERSDYLIVTAMRVVQGSVDSGGS